jgi:hypothetical protein
MKALLCELQLCVDEEAQAKTAASSCRSSQQLLPAAHCLPRL